MERERVKKIADAESGGRRWESPDILSGRISGSLHSSNARIRRKAKRKKIKKSVRDEKNMASLKVWSTVAESANAVQIRRATTGVRFPYTEGYKSATADCIGAYENQGKIYYVLREERAPDAPKGVHDKTYLMPPRLLQAMALKDPAILAVVKDLTPAIAATYGEPQPVRRDPPRDPDEPGEAERAAHREAKGKGKAPDDGPDAKPGVNIGEEEAPGKRPGDRPPDESSPSHRSKASEEAAEAERSVPKSGRDRGYIPLTPFCPQTKTVPYKDIVAPMPREKRVAELWKTVQDPHPPAKRECLPPSLAKEMVQQFVAGSKTGSATVYIGLI